ncbi:MAG: Rpn family recombination-promoting nuclease/putative transposase [Lachnospiraceae bacterium]
MSNRKLFDELTISDNYMFSKVMLNQELAKHFLEMVLGCKIKEVSYPSYEHAIDIRYDAKSIRLDIILEDDEHTVYNLEMQATKLDYLVKRSRYYQDLIDLDLLEKGADYDNLNRSLVIFVCTFDPFDKGQYLYSFQNMCKQLPSLALGDGTEKIFVNTKGYLGEVDEEFRQVMKIFNGMEANGAFAEALQQEVIRVRSSEKWRREYMTLQIFMDDARKEERKLGRAEGRAEGREEGRAEGRAEGQLINLIRQICKKLEKNKSVLEIADELEESEEDIRKIVTVMEKYTPEYDVEAICKELLQ